MKNEFIYKYFYYFLCFVYLHENSNHLVDTLDLKNEFMNKMADLNEKNKLFEIDEGFSELIYDMETCIFAKESIDIILNENRDFIFKFV